MAVVPTSASTASRWRAGIRWPRGPQNLIAPIEHKEAMTIDEAFGRFGTTGPAAELLALWQLSGMQEPLGRHALQLLESVQRVGADLEDGAEALATRGARAGSVDRRVLAVLLGSERPRLRELGVRLAGHLIARNVEEAVG